MPERVLVVEDDPSIRALMMIIVHRAGCEAVEAAGGAEALVLLKEQRFRLVILDLMMPSLGGFAVANFIATEPAERRPLVLIATAASESQIATLEPKIVSGVIKKPFDAVELVELIRRIVPCMNLDDSQTRRSSPVVTA